MISRTPALVLGAAAVALAAAVPVAVAAPAATYTVTAGTTTTGTTTYTAATSAADNPAIVINDDTSGLQVTCTSGTAKGSIKLGRGLPATGLATVTGVAGTGCLGPLSYAFGPGTVVGTWSFDATGATVNGVTPGVIRNIEINAGAVQGGCTFTGSGTVKARLTTTAAVQRLDLLPSLTMTLSKVVGCFGMVQNGDTGSIQARLFLSPLAGKLLVSSP